MKWLIFLALFPTLIRAGGNHFDWPAALSGVASGKQVWLDKVPELASVADVGQSIELEDALSGALTKNTPGVLNVLTILDAKAWPHMIGTDIVCGIPAEQSALMIRTFYHQTRPLLLATDKGAKCLWFLEATYAEWEAEQRPNASR